MMKLFQKYIMKGSDEVVLLSIHPEHAEKILSGEKKLEFRRTWAKRPVSKILIYVTAPVKKIVGVADIKQVHFTSIVLLWDLAKKIGGGLSKKRLLDYFSGKSEGYAIEIADVFSFLEAIEPKEYFVNFSAPQSFLYVSKEVCQRINYALEDQGKCKARRIIFVGGVHGVGKTTMCKTFAKNEDIVHRSAGDLIKKGRQGMFFSDKVVVDIDQNQRILLSEMNKITTVNNKVLLDGHFSVFNINYRPVPIESSVFLQLGITAIVVVVDEPDEIIKKIEKRDGKKIPLFDIENLQISEVSRAKQVAEEMRIPFVEVRAGDTDNFSKTINSFIS